MIKEKIPKLKKIKLSKNTKKIITTAVITFVVFMFFIWLGVGMYVSVPAEKRAELWPVFGMYAVFPALIFWAHRENIKRLRSGTEPSFGSRKK